nr:MAG TPA: hypothetical protein [Caudoviricetes sp.]
MISSRAWGKVNRYMKCNFWESLRKVKTPPTLPIRPGLKTNLLKELVQIAPFMGSLQDSGEPEQWLLLRMR